VNKGKLQVVCGWLMAISIILVSCYNLRQHSTPLVTIKLSSWGSSPVEQRLLLKTLEDFEVKHPQIKVIYELIAEQYMDVIKTRLIGEAAPDVFYLDALEAPFFMSQNVLEPLENYIKPEFDIGDFRENLLSIFRYKNHIYGFPKDYSTLVLFYNKKYFTLMGLDHPPIAWEQLRAYSDKLTSGSDIHKNYGFGDSTQLSHQFYKMQDFGGSLIDSQGRVVFNSCSNLLGLQLSLDMYLKDRSSALKSDLGVSSTTEMFGEGKVAMIVDGNWAIPYLQETFPDLDFGTAELPSINGNKSTVIFTVAYVMNHQTKHKTAAWELISYLTGKEGMSQWARSGFGLPTRKSVLQQLGYHKDPLRLPLIRGTEYGVPWQLSKYPAAIIDSFENQYISAFLGKQTLKQAMLKAESSANSKIQAME
jgi:multiple sugar transport system substrate-binding protein